MPFHCSNNEDVGWLKHQCRHAKVVDINPAGIISSFYTQGSVSSVFLGSPHKLSTTKDVQYITFMNVVVYRPT